MKKKKQKTKPIKSIDELIDRFKTNRCPYTGKCRSEGVACDRCKHNPDAKRDYYEPKDDPFNPYDPYKPHKIYIWEKIWR